MLLREVSLLLALLHPLQLPDPLLPLLQQLHAFLGLCHPACRRFQWRRLLLLLLLLLRLVLLLQLGWWVAGWGRLR